MIALPPERLTATLVDRLKPNTEIADEGERGLRVRSTANGVKSFRWAVRDAETGKLQWVTLGRFAKDPAPGFLTVNEARTWLRRLKTAHHARALPEALEALTAHLRPPREVAMNADAMTVGRVAESFWKVLSTRRKRGNTEAKALYDRHVGPQLGGVALRELQARRSLCVAAIERASGQKAKILALLKQLLAHGEVLDDSFVSPIGRLRAADFGIVGNMRRRWLSDVEIAAFWASLEIEPEGGGRDETRVERLQMSTALRLLLLTGLRSSELRLSEWSQVDFEARTLTIPVRHQKLTPRQAQGAQPFVVPLSPTALTLLQSLRERATTRWVLPGAEGPYAEKTLGRFMKRLWRGERPTSKPSRMKAEHARVRSGHPLLSRFEPASPHDLRRTMRSWLGRLDVAPHIAERCLNHRLGRIVETYDRHDYLEERRAALELWDAKVVTLTRSTNQEKS